MSQVVNVRYQQMLQRANISPVYLILFDGIPTRFSSGQVKTPLGPTMNIVKNLSGGAAQVTVDQGRTSLANTSIDILDVGAFITKTAFEYQLGNRKVTIKAGFLGLDEAYFVTAFVGRVNNYTLAADNVTWTFDLVSLFTDTFPNIFDQFCIEQGDIGAGDVTITVDSTLGFPASTAGVCYLVVDAEVISYTGVTPTTFTGCVRGLLGTTAAAHADQAQINNFLVLQGNPMTLALQIMLSTGAGTNGPYDVLPACAGLGIDQSLVDVAGIVAQQSRWLQSYIFRFEEFKSVVGKQFLEQQIYTFINAYPIINNLGQLSVHVYAPPLPSQINAILNDMQLAAPPTYSGNVFSNYFYNEVDFSFDYNFLQDLTNTAPNQATGPYGSRQFYENLGSQAIFDGQVTTKTWQSRGLRTNISGITVIQRVANRFLKRFSVPSPLMKASVFYSQRLLQQADIVPITSAKVPNLSTGKLGINAKMFEILGITPNYIPATQDLLLLDTGYSYGRKYASISPSAAPPINFPVFLKADAAQRNYAFISQKINATTGHMSDGSDGYYVTP